MAEQGASEPPRASATVRVSKLIGSGGSGFWAVAFAFLIAAGFATLPSPLYGLYRERDGLSALTITVVYAIFAGGTIAALLAVPAIARGIGRRGGVLAPVANMMVAARGLGAWQALPGPLLGRLI